MIVKIDEAAGCCHGFCLSVLLPPRTGQQQQTWCNCPEVRPALAGRLGRRLPDIACASKYLYLRGVIATSRGCTGDGRADPEEERRGREMERPRQKETETGQLASIHFPSQRAPFQAQGWNCGSLLDSNTHRQANAPSVKTFYDTCCLNHRSRVGVSEMSLLLVGAAWYGPGTAQTMVEQV